MSNSMPGARGRGVQGVPTGPTGQQIASYQTYSAAQAAVDFLSDEQFPVQHVTIVGTELRMVERVLGRLTYGRVALAGLGSGAWFGLLIGLILLLFSPPEAGLGALLAALLIGAAFGVLFGLVSYAATRGRRDFTSVSQIVATRYAVFCAEEHMGPAREVLGRNPEAAMGLQNAGWAAAGQGSGSAPGGYPYGQQQPVGQPGPQRPPDGEQSGQAAPPQVSGPTYSEMLARRREQESREQEGTGQEGTGQDQETQGRPGDGSRPAS